MTIHHGKKYRQAQEKVAPGKMLSFVEGLKKVKNWPMLSLMNRLMRT